MIIYGRRPVAEYLKAGGRPKVIYLQRGSRFEDELLELISGHRTLLVPSKEINRLTSVRDHQGIAADIGEFKTYDRSRIITTSLKTNRPVLVVDRIQDVRNLGALIRSAEAFGFAGVVIPRRRTASITPAVVKTSAGAIFHIPVTIYNAAKFLSEYKKKGGFTVGLDMTGKDITTTRIPSPVALVVGSEGKGLSDLVRRSVDLLLKIPMFGRVQSLNASVAGGIGMFWIRLFAGRR
ncbi:MAG: 23S rRNA (guanosine(2251)-2'-O)-methyltransferase RlmB [Thermotogae bacterium]|nr:23S rRNA (guanosine(2251)-2'-O)-methyltransferase RlmB [Thermotogota bacterium]